MQTGYKIFAETKGKEFVLMQNGRCPLIGQVYFTKQYLPNGNCIGLRVVEFDFDQDGNRDVFVFDGDIDSGELLFHSISLTTPAFITDSYREFLQKPSTAKTLAESIAGLFTMRMLGF
jgi:hypothetical protein